MFPAEPSAGLPAATDEGDGRGGQQGQGAGFRHAHHIVAVGAAEGRVAGATRGLELGLLAAVAAVFQAIDLQPVVAHGEIGQELEILGRGGIGTRPPHVAVLETDQRAIQEHRPAVAEIGTDAEVPDAAVFSAEVHRVTEGDVGIGPEHTLIRHAVEGRERGAAVARGRRGSGKAVDQVPVGIPRRERAAVRVAGVHADQAGVGLLGHQGQRGHGRDDTEGAGLAKGRGDVHCGVPDEKWVERNLASRSLRHRGGRHGAEPARGGAVRYFMMCSVFLWGRLKLRVIGYCVVVGSASRSSAQNAFSYLKAMGVCRLRLGRGVHGDNS